MIALNADDDDDPVAGLGGTMISLDPVDIDALAPTEVLVDANNLMIAPSGSIDIADTMNYPVATSSQIVKPVKRHRKTPLRTRTKIAKSKNAKPSPPWRDPSKVDAEVRAYAQKAGVQPVQHVLF